ncbi:MAG: hypothetical protein LJE63_10690 [Desulfobacteraceae bacterium]|nr:hypothetical protein [Desulfobacteraceae bacterium]
MKRARLISLSLVLCAALAGGAQAASFLGFDFRGGSEAYGVSADGSVAVGWGIWGYDREAFRWTQSSGAVDLGFLPDTHESIALSVSADGSTVVGYGRLSVTTEAFRWTQGDGMVGLGFLPEGSLESYAYDVSADGAIVVGGSSTAEDEKFEAFRWTQSDGMVGLGYLPGHSESCAFGVSADGAIVVGRSEAGEGVENRSEAFRWTPNEGMVGLGFLSRGDLRSGATDVSADGAIVVGYSVSSSGYAEAFRWTQSAGMVGLGHLPGCSVSVASAVSADGSTVVGNSGSGDKTEAFIWDEKNGMRNLRELLIDACGLDLNAWTLERATGISSDGKTIVGTGSPNGYVQGWIANLEKKEDFPWEIFIPLFKRKPKIF